MITFPLDREPDGATLVYRPWGVRAIKLLVTSEVETAVLRIRPRAIKQTEADAGIFRASADDSDAFVISWGGGHEPGPCLKAEDYLVAFERCAALQPGDTSLIYFNLDHIGPDLPGEATVTIEAYDEKMGEVKATLPIRLQKPPAYNDSVVQFIQNGAVWQPQGTQVASYEPRWWPRPAVDYVPLATYPLQVRLDGKRLLVEWGGKTVAQITDHTDPTVLLPQSMRLELFEFDRSHLALRAWFFWLDKNIGSGHEVPDAERFDMLLRKQDGYVTLACTDMHWREMWAQIDGAPMEATLGMSRAAKLKLLTEGIAKVKAFFTGEKEADHDGVFSPVDGPAPLIPKQAARLGGGDFATRGKGAEAHLPTIINVVEQSDATTLKMVSSDVRLG
ncbi:MAG: hypothetical protein H6662_15970 [Ardenticatenaceae bacterium]|nr:hypothetical protein [Ardenticatenaceae bacterium]